MIQDNAGFTFLHRIADVDRGKIRHLSKVLLGDVFRADEAECSEALLTVR